MAVYPCDWDRHRYRAPQQSIYYTHVIGHLTTTYKLRLCPQHFDESVELITAHLAEIEDASTVSDQCEACDQDANGLLSAKVFPLKKEPITYVADFCARCCSEAGQTLHVFNGAVMQDVS